MSIQDHPANPLCIEVVKDMKTTAEQLQAFHLESVARWAKIETTLATLSEITKANADSINALSKTDSTIQSDIAVIKNQLKLVFWVGGAIGAMLIAGMLHYIFDGTGVVV